MWYLSIDNDANWSNEWMNEWPMQTIKKNAKAPVVVAAFLHTLTIGQFNSFQLTRISENESGWGRETAMGVLLIVPILSCASVLCNVQMKEHANLNRIILTQEKKHQWQHQYVFCCSIYRAFDRPNKVILVFIFLFCRSYASTSSSWTR